VNEESCRYGRTELSCEFPAEQTGNCAEQEEDGGSSPEAVATNRYDTATEEEQSEVECVKPQTGDESIILETADYEQTKKLGA